MKVISGNLITAISASSEAPNYPASVLLNNEHPKDYWQSASGINQASLSLMVSSLDTERVVIKPSSFVPGVSAIFGDDIAIMDDDPANFGDPGSITPAVLSKTGIALFNTNATSAVINISDPNEVIWVDTVLVDTVCESYLIPVRMDLVALGPANAIWAEFDSVPAAVQIDIVLSCDPGESVRCGSPVVGELASYPCPNYGFTRGIVSYSITRELNNGAFWHKRRDDVRSIDNLSFRVTTKGRYSAEEFYRMAMDTRYAPMAWNIIDSDGFEYVVFARFQQKPQVQQINAVHSQINFSLIEVL